MNYSKIFKRIGFAFVYIICFLVQVELTLRILGYFYSQKTDLDKIGDKQIFSVVCLGDSFTYGWGVETVYTYPKQLEKMLNNGNLNKRFKVFNLAVPGSNSSQHLKYLEEILNKYRKPDLIILLTGANDSWNLADSNIYRFINKDKEKSNLVIKLKIFLSNFRIYKMPKIILLNLKGRPPESTVDPFKLIPRYENIDEVVLKKLLEYNLTQIATLAKSNNVKLILQNYPRGDLYGDNITQEVALHFDLPFVDNFSVFEKKLKELDFKDLFLYDNSHPNATGYRIIAEGIYNVICREVFR